MPHPGDEENGPCGNAPSPSLSFREGWRDYRNSQQILTMLTVAFELGPQFEGRDCDGKRAGGAMKRAGVLSGGTYADPRLLKVQVERAAKAIRGSIWASIPWVVFFAVMTSDPVPFLGKLPIANAVALVAIVVATAAFAWVLLKSFENGRGAPSDSEESARWLR